MTTVHDTPSLQDRDRLRQAAVRRIEARREFWVHASAYVLINGTLIVTWTVLGADGLFWPVFPLAGWGVGLVFHALDVFRRPPSEDRVRREMQRLETSAPDFIPASEVEHGEQA